ncbi:acyl carrier protein [Salmonella enterica subsp. enterica serovar Choleraesuis]|nr:acyl carrier protein [Salmonella enterica subsp. enterica serovar Choleraesuis]
MVDDIEARIFALARRYNGIYLFNNKKKQQQLTLATDFDTDMLLDIGEAEDLMDEFFTEFQVARGDFKIETYYPDVPFSWNPFKKSPPIPVPDFTIGMLIESAKAGRWLYD